MTGTRITLYGKDVVCSLGGGDDERLKQDEPQQFELADEEQRIVVKPASWAKWRKSRHNADSDIVVLNEGLADGKAGGGVLVEERIKDLPPGDDEPWKTRWVGSGESETIWANFTTIDSTYTIRLGKKPPRKRGNVCY